MKQARVRYAGTQRNTTLISNFRIDADYREPHGGFRSIKVTYQWEENGQPRQDVHVARRAQDTYVIACGWMFVRTWSQLHCIGAN